MFFINTALLFPPLLIPIHIFAPPSENFIKDNDYFGFDEIIVADPLF